MANIGIALREEVTRLAKKANKSELQALRKASAEYRHQIAALKQELSSMQKALNRVTKHANTQVREAPSPEDGAQLRFSAKGFAKKRQQLGLSAANMAKLLGVSALSVYKWESGQAKPRAKQLQAISRVRALGKRAALAQLEMIGS